MTRFMEDTFDVPVGGSQAYRDGWERVFGGEKADAPDGWFLTLEGRVFFTEREGGVVVSEEEVDGGVILQLVIKVLEAELIRLAGTDVAGSPGAPVVKKTRRVKK